MTTQEKIDVLENAITLINHEGVGISGICSSIYAACDDLGIDMGDGPTWDKKAELFISEALEMELPPKRYSSGDTDRNEYCWPLTPEGDEQRRAFLRSHIERLKKELNP